MTGAPCAVEFCAAMALADDARCAVHAKAPNLRPALLTKGDKAACKRCAGDSECDRCEGTGEVICDYGHGHACEDCHGSGECPDCHPRRPR